MSLLRRLFALVALATIAFPAPALTEADLLPVEQAFVLSAKAPSRDRIEITWKIADDYYLYRHRTSVTVEDDEFQAGPLQLPAGHKKHDEFFGDVETYRGVLNAVLPGVAAAGTDTVMLKVKYQGCADAGICYPPQTRSVQVKLPPATDAAPTNAAAGGKLAALLGKSAAADGAAVDSVPLPPERAFGFEAIAEDGNTLLLRFTPAPGYYLYRDRTTLKLEGANNIQAGRPRWPAGKSHHDEHFGDVTVYFDQIEVPVPLLRERANATRATLVTTFQGCQTDGICYPPITRRVKLALPAGKVTPKAEVVPFASTSITGGETTQAATTDSDTAPDASATTATDTSGGIVPDTSADNAQHSQPSAVQSAPVGQRDGLLFVLLSALIGGLILNLMPCVLPVLSLKAIGLAQSGESRAHARAHAIWYTLGVLASFTAIGLLVVGLRTIGQAAGWGFQLQQPWFVAALVYLMFAVGLSLSGVFTLGAGIGGIGQQLASRDGRAGDFFTGVLACVVASPCIAPFMGPALAYAFIAPAPTALLVFLTLGLGLALPFIMIGFVPALANRLPKPGAWMETLKQILAFPMYLTAIWLIWILGKQRGVDAIALILIGAAVLALGLWWYERSRWRSHHWGRGLALIVIVLALVPVWGVTRLPPATKQNVEAEGIVAYSPAKLDRLRADNRVVFVNMTADWCVTCKANEKNVLSSDEFRNALQRANAVYMRGDWTSQDEDISDFLKNHNAVGVPLYVVYGPGMPPAILPAILTQAIVDDALTRAAQ